MSGHIRMLCVDLRLAVNHRNQLRAITHALQSSIVTDSDWLTELKNSILMADAKVAELKLKLKLLGSDPDPSLTSDQDPAGV